LGGFRHQEGKREVKKTSKGFSGKNMKQLDFLRGLYFSLGKSYQEINFDNWKNFKVFEGGKY